MTGWVVRYEAIEISWLLSGTYGGNFRMYSFMNWEPVEIGQKLRGGDRTRRGGLIKILSASVA